MRKLVGAAVACARAAVLVLVCDLLQRSAAITPFVLAALVVATLVATALAALKWHQDRHNNGKEHARAAHHMPVVAVRGVLVGIVTWLLCYGLASMANATQAILLEGATSALLIVGWRRRRAGLAMMIALLLLLLSRPSDGGIPAAPWLRRALGTFALITATGLALLVQNASRRLLRDAGGLWGLLALQTGVASACCMLGLMCQRVLAAPPHAVLGVSNTWWTGTAAAFAVVQQIIFWRLARQSHTTTSAAALVCVLLMACAISWARADHALDLQTSLAAVLILVVTRLEDSARDGRSTRGSNGLLLPVRSPARGTGRSRRGFDAFCDEACCDIGGGVRVRNPYAGDESAIDSVLGATFASRSTSALAAFLALSFGFMAVEATVGILSDSLTLTTDAAHMLLDCVALGVGLYGELRAHLLASADALSSWQAKRLDTTCAFINAALLVVVAILVVCEAASEIVNPHSLIDDDRLLPVAVAGLVLNLVGLKWFHGHTHSHANGGCADASCGYGSDSAPKNNNMRGVFLHVLADTMGSIATIISTLLERHLRWSWADPVCSLLVAVCIFAAALPLLRDSWQLLRVPSKRKVDDDDDWQESDGLVCELVREDFL